MPEQERKQWFDIKDKGDGAAEVSIYDYIAPPGWGGHSAKDFAAQLKSLGAISSLTIRINSPGGDVFEGQAIYSQLKAHKARKTVYVDGLAASIASIIAMAGDEVLMPENAMMMIHDPSSAVWGTAEEMKKLAETLDKVKSTLVSVYARKTGLSHEEVGVMMADETWMTAEEAVSKGFADRQTDALEIAAHFDLSKFRNVPTTVAAVITRRPFEDSHITKEEKIMSGQVLTIADVERHADIVAHFMAKGKEAGNAEAYQLGVKAERERVGAIYAGMLPGQEAVVKELIEIGATAEEAAKTFRLRKLADLTSAAPTTAGGGSEDQRSTVDLSALPIEERCKAEWEQNVNGVRDEFTSLPAYVGFAKADARGAIKILQKNKE